MFLEISLSICFIALAFLAIANSKLRLKDVRRTHEMEQVKLVGARLIADANVIIAAKYVELASDSLKIKEAADGILAKEKQILKWAEELKDRQDKFQEFCENSGWLPGSKKNREIFGAVQFVRILYDGKQLSVRFLNNDDINQIVTCWRKQECEQASRLLGIDGVIHIPPDIVQDTIDVLFQVADYKVGRLELRAQEGSSFCSITTVPFFPNTFLEARKVIETTSSKTEE